MKLEELVVEETRGRKADYRTLEEQAREWNVIYAEAKFVSRNIKNKRDLPFGFAIL